MLTVRASGPGYEGFVVIDSILGNTSSGGVRIAADLELEEVRDLAREMTLKYSLFRLPRGGAKAGLRLADTVTPKAKQDALRDFGRRLGPILRDGIYNPGMDMNCGPEDLQALYAGAGIHIGAPTDTSFFTAITAANALEGIADAWGGTPPFTLAIDGFGSVGRHLAALLPANRFRITAISTVRGAVQHPEGFEAAALVAARDRDRDALVGTVGGTPLDPGAILELPVDLLVPAARTGSITAAVAERIQARAIVPVANAPYRPGTAARLQERGIQCLPGYLGNAGGVFGSSLHDNGLSVEEIQRLIGGRFRPLVRELITRSGALGRSPVEVVEGFATREAERRSTLSLHRSLGERIAARLSRRLPRRTRQAAARRQCVTAFDALEADLAGLR